MNRLTRWARAIALGLFGLAILTLSGCATRAVMPYSTKSQTAPRVENAALLMTATVRNDHHPKFQPNVIVVYVELPNASQKSERLNFLVDDDARALLKQHGEYLIRLEVPPGEYVLRGMLGHINSFPVLASCIVPLHSKLVVEAGGVYYIGHVDAFIRERKEGEFRAGPILPLVDQAVAGFSGGTFDVAIVDHADVDVPRFRAQFPGLTDADIKSAILPPFDRDFAQKWWQEH